MMQPTIFERSLQEMPDYNLNFDTLDFDLVELAEAWYRLMGQDIPGVEVVDDLLKQHTLISDEEAYQLHEWYEKEL
jgi:hypothetical protein